MGTKRDGYDTAGDMIATAADLRGWSLAKVCQLTGIPSSRMDRIVHGARLQYEDGLKLEDVLGLDRGRLSMAYRDWATKRRKG